VLSTRSPYLPKPNHLVYIKPTVAVVADVASRASVGLKMTIGNNQLERYVIEYYSSVCEHCGSASWVLATAGTRERLCRQKEVA